MSLCVSSEPTLNTPELVSEPQELSRTLRSAGGGSLAGSLGLCIMSAPTKLLKPTEVLDLRTEVEVVILGRGLSRDVLWLPSADLARGGLGGVRRRAVPM